jgi:ribosomal protein S18 acetylase RimI-like enzyme
MSSITIRVASALDIPELVLLMRAYCDASDEPHVAKPTNEDLLKLCQNVLKDPEHEGIYLLAQTDQTIGFASLCWSWSLLPHPGRQAILSDLYVSPSARGFGVAERLIRACQEQARQRENIRSIVWQTASNNYSAQKVYHRLGLEPKQCIDYELVLFEKKFL